MDMDMDAFEARLAALTSNRAILGAIGHVVDKSGRVLYSRAAGPAALPSPSAQTTGEGGGEGAPALTADNILSLGSAGKFVYHVAALQCVEDGLLTLDEPIGTHIPELDRLLRIIPDDKTAGGFSLRAPLRRITLRHLLTHTSGIGESPLVDLWEKSGGSFVAETASRPIKMFSTPLVADPGEHFEYGNANVFWVSLLPSRLMPDRYPRYGEYLDARIVKPMGLTSVTPNPATDPERAARMLQAVARSSAGDGRVDETGAAGADDDAAKGVDGGLQQSATPPPPLVPAPPHFAVGLACSTTDLAALLVDLVSDAPRLLPTRAAADLLLAPAFPLPPASSAAADSAGESTPFEDAAARSFRAWAMREDMLSHAGVTRSCDASAQNWTLAGAWRGDGDGDGLGGVPPGSVGWSGAANVAWVAHRGRGIVAIFATQFYPTDDPAVVDLSQTFFRGVRTLLKEKFVFVQEIGSRTTSLHRTTPLVPSSGHLSPSHPPSSHSLLETQAFASHRGHPSIRHLLPSSSPSHTLALAYPPYLLLRLRNTSPPIEPSINKQEVRIPAAGSPSGREQSESPGPAFTAPEH